MYQVDLRLLGRAQRICRCLGFLLFPLGVVYFMLIVGSSTIGLPEIPIRFRFACFLSLVLLVLRTWCS